MTLKVGSMDRAPVLDEQASKVGAVPRPDDPSLIFGASLSRWYEPGTLITEAGGVITGWTDSASAKLASPTVTEEPLPGLTPINFKCPDWTTKTGANDNALREPGGASNRLPEGVHDGTGVVVFGTFKINGDVSVRRVILDCHQLAATNLGISVFRNTSGLMAVSVGNGATFAIDFAGADIDDTDWHWFTVVHQSGLVVGGEGFNHDWRVYVDGVLQFPLEFYANAPASGAVSFVTALGGRSANSSTINLRGLLGELGVVVGARDHLTKLDDLFAYLDSALNV